MHFGEHLTIDGYGGELKFLDDGALVTKILADLPARLGMETLGAPQIFEVPARGPKDPGGWTGIVAIAESHISIHTFPKRGFVTADVYTCQNGLDTEKISNYFKEQFHLTKLETNFIKRGLEYPEKNIY